MLFESVKYVPLVASGPFQFAPVESSLQSEAVQDRATQVELVIQAEEKYSQAVGSVLPTVTGSGTYLVQPTPQGVGSSFSPPEQKTVVLTAVQPLFRGFREYSGLRQQKRFFESSQMAREQAIIQIFLDTMNNFYLVLSLERDIVNVKNEIGLFQKRLGELQDFRRIGRSKESEVLTFKSSLAALESQLEGVQRQLETARDVFVFLTGLDHSVALVDSEQTPQRSVHLQTYLDRIELRPDVQSLVKSAKGYEEGVQMAWGAHLPTLNLQGDYYLARPGSVYSTVNWDVQVLLSVPIFSGGVIQAQVRQAESASRQAQLALSKAKRTAYQQIQSYFHSFQGDYSQYDKQKIAVDLAMKTYLAERTDYRMGRVTNLEVLTALTSSQEGQRALDKIWFQLKTDFLALEASAALRPKPVAGVFQMKTSLSPSE